MRQHLRPLVSYGRAALAALDRIARGSGPEARGARDDARQIRAYLRGPGR